MTVLLSPVGGVAAQFFDNSGYPLTGGKLYSYAAGSTTPQQTYTSSSGSTPHSNPIILDSAGRVSNGGEVWLTAGLQYKFVLKTSTDTLIATYDNIVGGDAAQISYTPPFIDSVATNVEAKLAQTVSVKDFGAVGDGTTDDLAAFTAANANGKPIFMPFGSYRLSSPLAVTVPILSCGATVTPDTGSWLPRFSHDVGLIHDYTKKVNVAGDYVNTPTSYTYLDTFGNTYQRLINQAGYQQNFGSDSGGRTLVPVNYANVNHSGYGDCNIFHGAIQVSQHGSAASVTKWVGHNSGTVNGGQVNAGSAQVNLYAEEYHIEDKGYNDVAGLGIVLDFYRTGVVTKAYDSPWIGLRLMDAQGGNALDAAVQVCNTWKVGIDFSQATLTSDKNAISLKQNDRIYWGVDAAVVASDQWYAGAGAAGLGTTWTAFDGTSLVTSVGNNPILQLTSTHAVVAAGAANDFAFRVFGNSATAFGAMGNIGAITYVSAASSGSDNTTLSLRTANAGAEADRLVIDSTGVMDYKLGATAASVAANFTATHYMQMKLNGVTYYVPARASTW